MGDIADSMIDGQFDFYTGEYIGRGVGYPRTIDGSLSCEKRKRWQHNPKRGVINWLNLNGVKDKQRQMELLRLFVIDSTHNDSKESLCLKASEKFSQFAYFVRKTQIDAKIQDGK